MNFRMVFYLLGWILNMEAVFMALPCVTALVYGEKSGFYFLITAIIVAIIGVLLTIKKPVNRTLHAREGFAIVSLGWILMSIVGAMPFFVSGEIPGFEDALFETISGFTTTGASILTNVDGLSKCMLMWRSFSHWIGGMGVLVFMLAILPMVGGQSMHILRAESPGPIVSKIVPKMRDSAALLYIIYIVMTIVEILLLVVTKMPVFDAITLSFGTAGTGGFAVRSNGMADYTAVHHTIITVFMILFGVNFNVYFLMIARKPKDILKNEEVRWYFIVIVAAILGITLSIHGMFDNWLEAFRHAAFQVASIITTTGYATVDFNLWPMFAKLVLVFLMFIGACAGSTGGGIKVSRILISAKAVKKELYRLIHPRNVKVLKLDGKKVEHETMRSINVFLFAYAIVFVTSLFMVSLDNFEFSGTFTAVAATLNNIGPGLGQVGPMSNFSEFSVLSKCVLMFDMLAGRLEIFPMLLLLVPATWKRQ
jgi:trk system potassium uptake protein TrkH